MSVVQICGAAVCCLAAALILKVQRPETALILSVIGGVMIMVSAVSSFEPVLEFVRSISDKNEFAVYIPVLLKALGIGFAVQITSDICRDAGEGGLASKIEIFGKVQIILISIPLISDLINLAESLAM